MHAAIVDRLELESDLRMALERGELYQEYQPVVALETGEIQGFEALTRWNHPTRGLIMPPNSFRSRKRRGSSSTSDNGSWRPRARSSAGGTRSRRRRRADVRSLRVGINISGHQVQSERFSEHVAKP